MHLAECARGQTSPNPIVGAVIVRGAEVLGEGYHAGPGQDHAEVAAMKDALHRAGRRSPSEPDSGGVLAWLASPELFAGTTMYVSLEPCCTYGRTPPCTDALLKGGFARVVVGAVDPSPAVDGKGLEILRGAGMQVELAEADLAQRAKRQNCGVRKAATARSALRDLQVRHDPRWACGDRRGRFPLDIRRREQGARASLARLVRRGRGGGGHACWPTIRR